MERCVSGSNGVRSCVLPMWGREQQHEAMVNRHVSGNDLHKQHDRTSPMDQIDTRPVQGLYLGYGEHKHSSIR